MLQQPLAFLPRFHILPFLTKNLKFDLSLSSLSYIIKKWKQNFWNTQLNLKLTFLK